MTMMTPPMLPLGGKEVAMTDSITTPVNPGGYSMAMYSIIYL